MIEKQLVRLGKDKDNINKLFNMIKDLQIKQNKSKSFKSIRNDRPYKYKLQDMTYNTNWKDGMLVRNNKTPDPLKRNNNCIENGP